MKDKLGIDVPAVAIPETSLKKFSEAKESEIPKLRDDARRAICKYMRPNNVPAVVIYFQQVADAGDLRRNVVMTFLRHTQDEFQIRLLADYLRMLALEGLNRTLQKTRTREKDLILIENVVCAGILACALQDYKETMTFLHRLERLGTQYFDVREEFSRLANQVKVMRSQLSITQSSQPVNPIIN